MTTKLIWILNYLFISYCANNIYLKYGFDLLRYYLYIYSIDFHIEKEKHQGNCYSLIYTSFYIGKI